LNEDQPGSGRGPDVDLKELSKRHISSIDKFYRMYAGAGSELTAFEDGTI
jgi:hypothetical protein